jgi:Protein of unknwon function (DUF3310)
MKTLADLQNIDALYIESKCSAEYRKIDSTSWVDCYGKVMDKDVLLEMWNKGDVYSLKDNDTYDKKGNAKHYTNTRIATINKIEQIWGTMGARLFCEMNAFKYRDRIGDKDSVNQEIKKIKWYDEAAKVLAAKEKSEYNIEGLPFDQEFQFKL